MITISFTSENEKEIIINALKNDYLLKDVFYLVEGNKMTFEKINKDVLEKRIENLELAMNDLLLGGV